MSKFPASMVNAMTVRLLQMAGRQMSNECPNPNDKGCKNYNLSLSHLDFIFILSSALKENEEFEKKYILFNIFN